MKMLTTRFVSLPEPIKAAVTALVLTLASLLFANLIVLAPFLAFLAPYVTPLASAIAMALIAAFEKAVPDAYASVAIAAVQLLLALVAVFTGISTLAAHGLVTPLLAP